MTMTRFYASVAASVAVAGPCEELFAPVKEALKDLVKVCSLARIVASCLSTYCEYMMIVATRFLVSLAAVGVTAGPCEELFAPVKVALKDVVKVLYMTRFLTTGFVWNIVAFTAVRYCVQTKVTTTPLTDLLRTSC